jgi:hypothetical protein
MTTLKVPCQYWSDCRVQNGGCCAIGDEARHSADRQWPRSMPCVNECARCPYYVGPARVGTWLEKLVKPIARALGSDCLDAANNLKPGSPCAQARNALNQVKKNCSREPARGPEAS